MLTSKSNEVELKRPFLMVIQSIQDFAIKFVHWLDVTVPSPSRMYSTFPYTTGREKICKILPLSSFPPSFCHCLVCSSTHWAIPMSLPTPLAIPPLVTHSLHCPSLSCVSSPTLLSANAPRRTLLASRPSLHTPHFKKRVIICDLSGTEQLTNIVGSESQT